MSIFEKFFFDPLTASNGTIKKYFYIFWTIVFAGTLLTVLTCWCIIRYYNQHLTSEYEVLLNYKVSIKNQKNNVVFIGDSSCLMGIVPKVITEETNLKVINLATYGATGIIGYDIILRKYLENNAKPDLIIFYVSPSIPNSYNQTTFEKIFTYVRYGSFVSFIKNLEEWNPLQALPAFITFFINKNFSPSPQEDLNKLCLEIQSTLGYQKSNAEEGLQESYSLNSRNKYGDYFYTKHDPRKRIKRFLKNFSSDNIKIILYVAPVPSGEEAFEYFKMVYKGLAINDLYKLKNQYFTDYAHLNYKGAVVNSKIVSEFLKQYFSPSI